MIGLKHDKVFFRDFYEMRLKIWKRNARCIRDEFKTKGISEEKKDL